MNLQPINPPIPDFTFICAGCGDEKHSTDGRITGNKLPGFADLDGEPYKAYYCGECAEKIKQSHVPAITNDLKPFTNGREFPSGSTLEFYRFGGYHNAEEHFICRKCETTFPVIDGEIKCNGAIIDQCPWCRPDSKPWTNGRGL